jgi:hypothetical protein
MRLRASGITSCHSCRLHILTKRVIFDPINRRYSAIATSDEFLAALRVAPNQRLAIVIGRVDEHRRQRVHVPKTRRAAFSGTDRHVRIRDGDVVYALVIAIDRAPILQLM